MVTIAHVVGARPNFIKAGPVIGALADAGRSAGLRQRLIHTGQHYSDALSAVFFRELDLPEPDVNLEVGSGSHAVQTAAILTALESELLAHRPDRLVVYGDVNSTLAASLVAAKLGIPTAHVESGLRSFDRSMPEEINRIVTDHLADLLFATSADAVDHLTGEGIHAARIHLVGNPMIDTLLAHLDRFDPAAERRRLGLSGDYAVVTLHRPANVDDPAAARRLAAAIRGLSELIPLVIPIHPRSREAMAAAGLADDARTHVIEPLGYIDFVSLVRGARLVATDSGGIQEETTVLGIPCLTLRPNTERPITISHGTNRLVQPDRLVDAAREVLSGAAPSPKQPPLWDGHAGERIASILLRDAVRSAAEARPELAGASAS